MDIPPPPPPPPNSTDAVCVISANPDVTGIGIRASIYALCLATSLLKTIISQLTTAKNYDQFSRSLNSALQLQGLALLCTAIYQTTQQQLTLFHAICVMHLLSLLGFGLVAQRKYEPDRGTAAAAAAAGLAAKRNALWRLAFAAATRVLVAAAFVALTAYIWVTAPTFGSQPECNASTVYVAFGLSIRATNDVFRYVILALMVAMAVSWVVSLVIGVVVAKCCCGGVRKAARGGAAVTEGLTAWAAVYGRAVMAHPTAKRSGWQGQVANMLLHMGINVYMIVTLEQIVTRNRLPEEEREWTFGQVLALFLLLGVVVEVGNILLPKVISWMGGGRDGDEETASLNSR
ncbi:hypothetical protein QBC39DRAFT_396840 [Podospora conica]|nr:hypothetical protein QBC39DRAFT_396840 [Schizothecium conicum]